MMDTDDRKRVLIPVDVANEVLSNGPQRIERNGETVVVTEDDIPTNSLNDCCYRSENMIDESDPEEEKCHKCGRVFNTVHNYLARFDPSNTTDEIVVYIPRKEFLEN